MKRLSKSGGAGGLKSIFTSPLTPVVIGLVIVLGAGWWATKDSPAGEQTAQTDTGKPAAGASQPSASKPQAEAPPVKAPSPASPPSSGQPKAETGAGADKATVAARSKIDRSGGQKAMMVTVFYSDELTGGMSLQPVEMKVTHSVSRIKTTVEQILRPPQELKLHSNIPAGTKLLSANLKNGVAIVDLSPELATARGAEAVNNIMASFVYSLTEIEDVMAVQLWVNGRPALLDGMEWAKPISRAEMDARNLYKVEPVTKFTGS